MIPARIEPVTFRFAAQHLNHRATAVPKISKTTLEKIYVAYIPKTYRMFIGPCIIVIVEELKTNLMSLIIFISLIICSTCFGH